MSANEDLNAKSRLRLDDDTDTDFSDDGDDGDPCSIALGDTSPSTVGSTLALAAAANASAKSRQRSSPASPRSGPASQSDLAAWAPQKLLSIATSDEHLPPLDSDRVRTITSRHISDVQHDLEYSISQLLSEKVFEDLMMDPVGRHRFREYLISSRRDFASLDLWWDLRAFKKLSRKINSTSVALHDLLSYPADSHPSLSPPQKEDLLNSFLQASTIGDSLELPRQHLLRSLYKTEFKAFVQYKLIEETTVTLGRSDLLPADRHGLGDAFCLSNPRLQDHPICLVSPGFEALTGYRATSIIGRNCRFLAGPATSPASSARIRESLRAREGSNSLILNYRRDGSPFFNLLCIIPLHDTKGELTYFIGGQTEVTNTLASGGNIFGRAEDSSTTHHGREFSPSLEARIQQRTRPHRSGSSGTSHSESRPGFPPTNGLAVGEIAFAANQDLGSKGSQGGTLRGGFKAFFGVKSKSRPIGELEQHFAGAETLLSKEARPIDLQLAQFQSVYSNLIIFRRKGREILFATPQLLRFCDLPHDTPSDIYRSPLIHADVLACLSSADRKDFTSLRRDLKQAIRDGASISRRIGFKVPQMYRLKEFTIHLSPLKDLEGVVDAYVAVIG